MAQLFVSPWTGVLAATVVTLVVVGLFLRYRALARAGTPLPPGAGGARMVGLRGTVTVAHRPGRVRGMVRVLGEEWSVADEVGRRLDVGQQVRVERVTGTRLVVALEDDRRRARDDGDGRREETVDG